MKKIIDRLAYYVDSNNISYNSFDKSIGASNGYFGKQVKNKASIGSDIIEKIISIYTDLNPVWLITGKGDMLLSKSYSQSENLTGVVAEPGSNYETCKHCVEKDQIISAQKITIESQMELIKMLKEKYSHPI